MTETMNTEGVNHKTLKEKWCSVIRGLHLDEEHIFDFNTRMKRVLSWLERAEKLKKKAKEKAKAKEKEKGEGEGEAELAFIAYWIAFNAAYGGDRKRKEDKEQKQDPHVKDKGKDEGKLPDKIKFELFLDRIVDCSLKKDKGRVIRDMLCDNDIKEDVKTVLESIHTDQKFWNQLHKFWNKLHKNLTYKDVESINKIEEKAKKRIKKDGFREEGLRKKMEGAKKNKETLKCLIKRIFSNLYVLRNTTMHGSAKLGSSSNEKDRLASLDVIAYILPRIVDVMLDNPEYDDYWGQLPYPLYKRNERDDKRKKIKQGKNPPKVA
ncbi:MAG: hypothetical protein GDA50_07565 [Alphaproteobacteria bacterium GM202ARS2]|nr:hypothetical protein [Alphaproteobacteria bacterium GM202ARS2]